MRTIPPPSGRALPGGGDIRSPTAFLPRKFADAAPQGRGTLEFSMKKLMTALAIASLSTAALAKPVHVSPQAAAAQASAAEPRTIPRPIRPSWWSTARSSAAIRARIFARNLRRDQVDAGGAIDQVAPRDAKPGHAPGFVFLRACCHRAAAAGILRVQETRKRRPVMHPRAAPLRRRPLERRQGRAATAAAAALYLRGARQRHDRRQTTCAKARPGRAKARPR